MEGLKAWWDLRGFLEDMTPKPALADGTESWQLEKVAGEGILGRGDLTHTQAWGERASPDWTYGSGA